MDKLQKWVEHERRLERERRMTPEQIRARKIAIVIRDRRLSLRHDAIVRIACGAFGSDGERAAEEFMSNPYDYGCCRVIDGEDYIYQKK